MHPHIPRPRRKATCTDTAGVVRTVHRELMWPFSARVNEKNRTDRTHRCRCNLPTAALCVGRSMSAIGQKQTSTSFIVHGSAASNHTLGRTHIGKLVGVSCL